MKKNDYYFYNVQLGVFDADNVFKIIHSFKMRASDVISCLRKVQSDAKELGLRGTLTVDVQRSVCGKPYGFSYYGIIIIK